MEKCLDCQSLELCLFLRLFSPLELVGLLQAIATRAGKLSEESEATMQKLYELAVVTEEMDPDAYDRASHGA